jgi:hypothetical protein
MISFKKQENPLVSLGVGQVNFIDKWLQEIKPFMISFEYKINKDLSIDVFGNCYLGRGRFKFYELPYFIKFNIIHGDFSCDSHNLISLKGCPKIVEGNFYCKNNNLTTLEGCPEKVGGIFNCRRNKVKFTKPDVQKLCKVKKDIYV